MAFPPHTFASQSGAVPAQELDDNFAACLPGIQPPFTILGNNQNATGLATGLTPQQAYQVLKGAIPFEIGMFLSGLQAVSGQQLLRYQPSTQIILITGACYASCGVTATGSATFGIADNGVTFGTIVFTPSIAAGVVSITGSPYTLQVGHVLTISGPGPADATLGNLNVTLGGFRN